jgi:hypothetical protein
MEKLSKVVTTYIQTNKILERMNPVDRHQKLPSDLQALRMRVLDKGTLLGKLRRKGRCMT